MKDIGLLFSLVLMGMLMFGSLAYYLENGEPDTGFQSIPQGMWCVVLQLLCQLYCSSLHF